MREAPVRVGPYEIVIELAAGGMATTYIAHKRGDAFFERLVVVKRIHPWLLQDPKSGDMLREEARLGAALQHPNVVHVEDVTVNDAEVCLVMPYVESLSLGALLKAVHQSGERMPPAITSRIMLDVLSGLNAAHEAKDLRGQPLDIVHRDVSPNNVLVGVEGQSRIIDFGIARARSRLCQTQSGDLKGTIAYMSPEQLRRRELDRRADVFAAGAVLYEMLAGERLFDGHDEADILIGVLADEIPSLYDRWPNLGSAIDSVVSRALARDRDERFPSAGAFAESLESALQPASSADVAALVRRFGADEFKRRRDAIRAFVDRQSVEGAPVVGHSETVTAESVSARKSKGLSRRTIASGAIGLAAVSVVAIAMWGPHIAPKTSAENAQSISPAFERIRQSISSAPIAIESPKENTAPMDSTSPPIAESSSKPLALPSVAPRPLPSPEKVDKRRASELQENPYR